MRVLTTIILAGLALSAPAWADDAVQYDPIGAAVADHLHRSEYEAAGCMERAQKGLLSSGERSRKILIDKSVEACAGGMRAVYQFAGRSDQDALRNAREIARSELEFVLSSQR